MPGTLPQSCYRALPVSSPLHRTCSTSEEAEYRERRRKPLMLFASVGTFELFALSQGPMSLAISGV
jgi:hypothetical protein